MEEYKLMWDAYYKLTDEHARVVTEEASRLNALTGLGLTDALYVLWKIGIYFAQQETTIFRRQNEDV